MNLVDSCFSSLYILGVTDYCNNQTGMLPDAMTSGTSKVFK